MSFATTSILPLASHRYDSTNPILFVQALTVSATSILRRKGRIYTSWCFSKKNSGISLIPASSIRFSKENCRYSIHTTTSSSLSMTTEPDLNHCITPRSQNYSKWYNDILYHSNLEESSPVRGCRVIKPYGMSIWDTIRNDLDKRIKKHGAENAYFPLLIPMSFLRKEAEHIDGFVKECVVVTHHRLVTDDYEKADGGINLMLDPKAKLKDPLVVRPTSEAMVWTMFKRWITSHRDLPLKINQWANVLRWELRPRPFLRTSEFLWQEGHTAHSMSEAAISDARAMLYQYSLLCRDLLALPTITGVKSPSERFAGAEDTYTIESLMPNGWALQCGTSHYLGQVFGKAFDVKFMDKNETERTVWGTSWGVSSRLLGALIMSHGDDVGLVLPPRVAPVQVIIVVIYPSNEKKSGKQVQVEKIKEINNALGILVNDLKGKELRIKVDDRNYVRNGVKYFEWERKGVPLRIELGPRDVQKGVCIFKYRVGKKETDKDGTLKNEKLTVNLKDAATIAKKGLEELQSHLLTRAGERLMRGITFNASYEEMKEALKHDEASTYPGAGLFLVPWKCDVINEAKVKQECKATVRCYPLNINEAEMAVGKTCFYSSEPATHMALFGRAF